MTRQEIERKISMLKTEIADEVDVGIKNVDTFFIRDLSRMLEKLQYKLEEME